VCRAKGIISDKITLSIRPGVTLIVSHGSGPIFQAGVYLVNQTGTVHVPDLPLAVRYVTIPLTTFVTVTGAEEPLRHFEPFVGITCVTGAVTICPPGGVVVVVVVDVVDVVVVGAVVVVVVVGVVVVVVVEVVGGPPGSGAAVGDGGEYVLPVNVFPD
jgi:hypothetical protein